MNPNKLYHVSKTQLSLARFYGRCVYNGETYTYDYLEDSLTRDKSLTKKQLLELNKKQFLDLQKLEIEESKKAEEVLK